MQRGLDTPARNVGPVPQVVKVTSGQLHRMHFLAQAHRFAEPDKSDVVCEDVILLRRGTWWVSTEIRAEQGPWKNRFPEVLLEAPVARCWALWSAVVLSSDGPVCLHLLAVFAVEAVAAEVHLEQVEGCWLWLISIGGQTFLMKTVCIRLVCCQNLTWFLQF